jgi:hypothetical protein
MDEPQIIKYNNQYYCKLCKYSCVTKQNYNKHINTKKHINKLSYTCHMNSEILFFCELCNFKCIKKQHYTNHLQTLKHLKIEETRMCKYCNKIYASPSGLYKHRKKNVCTQPYTNLSNRHSSLEELKELRKTVIELSKNIQPTIIQNINNNSNNATFNLQIFLNEKCKDAINITDFIENIKISLYDLENVGHKGFVKGISNIIIKNLSELDETKRPIHCSDAKRETLYIKDNNEWGKDNNGNPKMVEVVQHVSAKNIRQLNNWRDANPEFGNASSPISDTYQSIVRESCDYNGGSGESEAKIIKHISKSVVIDKIEKT